MKKQILFLKIIFDNNITSYGVPGTNYSLNLIAHKLRSSSLYAIEKCLGHSFVFIFKTTLCTGLKFIALLKC